MEVIFWTCLLLIVYCYFGYPLILPVIVKMFHKPVNKTACEPSVSIVLSAWNEEDVIKEKLENFLSLDYPVEKMEIIVGSDGSTDLTDSIVKSFSDNRIKLFKNTERIGKMLTINDLVLRAKNDVIIFTDARQLFAKDAIRELVANFSDPKIGSVSGELIFSKKDGGTAKGVNFYWNYEKFIRRQESDIHSMLGATGAIYAIRKELYTPIPANIVLDDVFVPLKIVQQGYRAIFDCSAKAFDEVADSPREENRRKARTLYGNYQIFGILPEMFNPFKSPVAIQLFSHKFLRVVAPFLMILLYFTNWSLTYVAFYKTVFFMQNIFYIMAVLGALARHKRYGILKIISNVCYLPYVFCLLNFSALIGFLRFTGSRQEITWEKARAK